MKASAALEAFVRRRTSLLTTYRRDGTLVGTPVHVAVEGDRAFVRTWDTTGKLKRIRNDPSVEVRPSTFGGRPTGAAIRARARILEGGESAHAGRMLARKYPVLHGLLIPLAHRLRGNETTHIELRPMDNGEVPGWVRQTFSSRGEPGCWEGG
jgi:PPOX class probable F420-dependent enzyme